MKSGEDRILRSRSKRETARHCLPTHPPTANNGRLNLVESNSTLLWEKLVKPPSLHIDFLILQLLCVLGCVLYSSEFSTPWFPLSPSHAPLHNEWHCSQEYWRVFVLLCLPLWLMSTPPSSLHLCVSSLCWWVHFGGSTRPVKRKRDCAD